MKNTQKVKNVFGKGILGNNIYMSNGDSLKGYLWIWIIPSVSLLMSIAAIITTIFIRVEYSIEIVSHVFVITIICGLATFVVISNYAQVQQIRKQFEDKIKDIEKDFKKEINDIDKIVNNLILDIKDVSILKERIIKLESNIENIYNSTNIDVLRKMRKKAEVLVINKEKQDYKTKKEMSVGLATILEKEGKVKILRIFDEYYD